ncbi:MAG: serine hydrolase domain-containing protein [Ekhidna sp.]
MKHAIILIGLLLSSCYISEELPPDQMIWEYELPENVGLDQFRLAELNNKIKFLEFEQLAGLIIIKDDNLVYENYYLENDRSTLNTLDGASMAITVAAIGIAVENGLFSLDDKIQDYLPEYDDVFKDNNNKTFITIRHLLLDKSGLSWSFNDYFDMIQTNNWVRYILEKPMQAPAGLQFNPNEAIGLLLAKIIESKSGLTFNEFVNQNIFKSLGISNFTIDQDSEGNYDGATGINLSLLDFTKIGYLMLEEGIWNGRRVLDPNFIEEATSIQTDVSATIGSGYSWTRFGNNFEDFFGINHEDFYFITGDLGQHLYIIPSQKMVVVIDAENFFFGFGNPSLNLLTEISYMIQ